MERPKRAAPIGAMACFIAESDSEDELSSEDKTFQFVESFRFQFTVTPMLALI